MGDIIVCSICGQENCICARVEDEKMLEPTTDLNDIKTAGVYKVKCEENAPILVSWVNHPLYYGGENNPYEVIKVIEAWKLGFNLGNTIKYIGRAGKKTKDTLKDLEKARWYLDREIQNINRRMGNYENN